MLKILFKKQMREVWSAMSQNSKNGKRKRSGSKAGYILLMGFLFLIMLMLFWMVADQLCAPLVTAGLDWFYFAIMGLISVALGAFGSIFSTYASLYLAKDNELLLAMPIKPSSILIARMMGVYAMGLIYEALVQIPTVAVYVISKGFAPAALIQSVLLVFILAFLILCLSCILGWVVALVSSKLKNKSFVTVILSLVFIAAYYYFYMNAFQYLNELLLNSGEAAAVLRSKGYLIYAYGMGASGSLLHFGIFLAFVAVCVAAVYAVLSRSYRNILMEKKGEAKKVYRERAMKKGSIGQALLWKEWKRFSTSATYMLNCGLGIVFLVILAGYIVIRHDSVAALVGGMFSGMEPVMPLLAGGILCMTASMNDIAAPSVSLEGRTVWIAQSIPADTWQILKAKLMLHILLTLPPVLLCAAALAWILPVTWAARILVVLSGAVYSVFGAALGLVLGLRFANLDWTNEMAVIKQGAAVTLALFGSWGVLIVLGAGYALLHRLLTPTVYLALCIGAVFAATCVMLLWLRRKGSRIFEEL